jgi:LysM repeat protein
MQKRFMILLISLAAVAVLAGASIIALRRIPTMSDLVQPGASSLHVSLITPPLAGAWPLDSYIPIFVSAEGGQPVKAIDLYINGNLYDSHAAPSGWAGNSYASHWNWQPGSQGQFTLLAYATNQAGQTGISSPVVIRVGPAGGSRTPFTVQAGNSLQSLASAHHLPLAQVQGANPGIDPAKLLDPGDRIYLPNPPAPITNLKIIPGFSAFQTGQSGSQGSSGTGNPAKATATPPGQASGLPGKAPGLFANVQFWLKTQSGKTTAKLPHAPSLKVDFSGCTAEVQFNNTADFIDPGPDHSYDWARPMNEDGFFLYRSQDGGDWVRIATWPKIVDIVDADKEDAPVNFTDQYGQVSFYLSAFNAAGETPGTPVSLAFDAGQCPPPANGGSGSGQLQLENGNLILPQAMDLAYFYLQINGARGIRVPEGDRTFLPASGTQLNLNTYLDTLIDTVQQPDLDLSLEVWGWSGGQLTFAGKVQTSLHRSVLTVCSVEGAGGCTGSGGGKRVGEANLLPNIPIQDQSFEFRWQSTSLSKVKQLCSELAAGPFPDDNYWNVALPISAGCDPTVKGTEGTYLENLGAELFQQTSPFDSGAWGWGAGNQKFIYASNWWAGNYKVDQPFSLYERVMPQEETSGYAQFSNTVVLHYLTPPVPSGLPPLSSPYPSLYDVQILTDEYVPPNFVSGANWGCVYVISDPTGQYSPQQELCPTPLQDTQDCGSLLCLMEGFASSLGQLYDYFTVGFDTMVQEFGSLAANIIPGCDSSPACSGVVQSAVKYGFSAISGLPPDLPSYSELISKDIVPAVLNEIIDDPTAGQLYGACSTCQQALEDQLNQEFTQFANLNSQAACIDAYEAWLRGLAPFCLDPNIVVQPVPGSYNFSGGIVVKITRKTTPEAQAMTAADAGKYQLTLVVIVDNPANASAQQGTIYEDVRVPIPWMQPGESESIPLALTPCLDHDINYCGVGEAWDAIKGLYYGGTSHMQATENCSSPGSSVEWVPCTNGGQDHWDFADPVGP